MDTSRKSGRAETSIRDAILKHPINMRSHARMLGRVEKAHFKYFQNNQNPDLGLVLDKDDQLAPASIAAVGFSLAGHACAVKRGWISRKAALGYCTKTLEGLWSAPQGPQSEGTSGYRGFFYHFLDPSTGLRATAPKYWNSELSSIDTALLMAGVLFVRNYFNGADPAEAHVRDLSTRLYERVEWDWLFRGDKVVLHGWTPESGVISHVYKGYSEALLLYALALGSPSHPAPDGAWQAFLGDASLGRAYGIDYVRMPGEPLFCYQYPHVWIDFRGIRDFVCDRVGFDWFENSRRMSLVHFRYAQANPKGFRGYGGFDWALTPCVGPGWVTKEVDGRSVEFHEYCERGCPDGFDDGTIAPTAAISAIPFVPELSIPTIRYWLKERPLLFSDDGGFADAFNPSFDLTRKDGWICRHRLGIDQGPILLMLENWRSGLVWSVMRKDIALRNGLIKAGFRGGWLQN